MGKFKSILIDFLKGKAVRFALKKLLGSVAAGGIRGFIIKYIVTHFIDEVIAVIEVTVDYIEINRKAKASINEKDRNAATDNLNDLIK